MKIMNTSIRPGKGAILYMDIARLQTRTKIEIPVIIERGRKPGPRLLLTAGIHGDEVNGVEIVRQIISSRYHKPDAGSVICIPVLNVFGFLSQSRDFPDGRDLNRVFPGTRSGSLASRFAFRLMTEILPHIDYCIDFHSGGASRFNYTQLRIEGSDEETLNLARVFGVKFIKLAKNREKSFREAATRMGKKVLVFEGGKSLHLDRYVTQAGIRGTLRVMQNLGMRDFSGELAESPPHPDQVLVHNSTWIRAAYSGMFRSHLRLGSFVSKGTTLGTISDPFGEFEKPVKARHDGFIICANHSPLVTQGDAIIHLSK